MAVSKRTRYEVLNRDNFTCRYCNATDVPLTLDHVVPITLGGSDDPSNLVAACRDCNAGKASTSPDAPLVEDVKNDAVRWAAAMKLAAKKADARRRAGYEYVDAWARDWEQYEVNGLPANWETSIDGFRQAGLPIEQLKEALAISMTKSHVWRGEKFRYMCGIAWSMIREMQDDARAILAADEGDL